MSNYYNLDHIDNSEEKLRILRNRRTYLQKERDYLNKEVLQIDNQIRDIMRRREKV